MGKVIAGLLMAGALLFTSMSALAHHGNAAYDPKKVTVKGTVTAWVWSNPHSLLKFDANGDKGDVVHWVRSHPIEFAIYPEGNTRLD